MMKSIFAVLAFALPLGLSLGCNAHDSIPQEQPVSNNNQGNINDVPRGTLNAGTGQDQGLQQQPGIAASATPSPTLRMGR